MYHRAACFNLLTPKKPAAAGFFMPEICRFPRIIPALYPQFSL
jgi:hypothetical protein